MKKVVCIFLTVIGLNNVIAQKTLTLEQCEKLFLSNNLMLLAEGYNIDMSRAALIQAKIWELPNFSAEINMLNPQDNRLFDIGGQGQKAFAVNQLVYLGKKKKYEVDFAKSNVEIAELTFEDLLRSLRFEIRKSFYEIYYSSKKAESINVQLGNIDSLISAYLVQARNGNVPLKDVVRLQSLSLSFRNELMDLQQNLFANQQNISILTGLKEDIIPDVQNANMLMQYSSNLTFDIQQLQQMAIEKNPEYLLSLKLLKSDENLLKWQRSLSVPDINLGASYDQRGGAFVNQTNLTVGIPLPLWDRNKGNIKIAEAKLKMDKVLSNQKQVELFAKINTAFNAFQFQKRIYAQSNESFDDLNVVYDGVLKNFQKRNLSLIEFTDFMESYNQSNLFLYEAQKQVILAGEMLNFLTNVNVF
jgi:cobalt-zinc-cadmium efflux system outer membrane protein